MHPHLDGLPDERGEALVARARRGDESAFRDLTEPLRQELHVHCYRILGSPQDAEDVLQEALWAAWRGLPGFEGRSSVRTWLYKIATNRCLNHLRHRRRRPREVPATAGLPEPTRWGEPAWLAPYPDALIDGPDPRPGPDARYEAREAMGLGFVAALHHLPPRQRVVVVLRDVLGFPLAEVAGILDVSEASAKGALQRGRAAMRAQAPTRAPRPGPGQEAAVVAAFIDALERGDVAAVVSLLTDDAWLTMPPEPHAYQGPAAIGGFLHTRAPVLAAGVRLVPTRANGQPAFGAYLPEPGTDPSTALRRSYGIIALTLRADRIAALTWFGDRGLPGAFGLPDTFPGR